MADNKEYIPMHPVGQYSSPQDPSQVYSNPKLDPQSKAEATATDKNASFLTLLRKSGLNLREALFPQVSREHRIIKLCWIAIYLGLSVAFFFHFKGLVVKYFSYPTLIEIEICAKAGVPGCHHLQQQSRQKVADWPNPRLRRPARVGRLREKFSEIVFGGRF